MLKAVWRVGAAGIPVIEEFRYKKRACFGPRRVVPRGFSNLRPFWWRRFNFVERGVCSLEKKILEIKERVLSELKKAESFDAIQEIRVKFLGKKGELTQVLRQMGTLAPEERPRIGQLANEVRALLTERLEKKLSILREQEKEKKLKSERIDVTLPGRPLRRGHRHPISLVLEEIKDIFTAMGFEIAEGPEVEWDYYNFEALNIPKDHPARDMQDSFYITDEILLRTHTSPVQVRVLEKSVPKVPVRIIAPGKVYRRDDDATHSPMFHQVEGLLVDKRCTLGDLKGVLLAFARQMFGQDRQIRLRPSFFPFTEPSAEVDISCVNCGGKGCRVCSWTGWLEILGAGMVHPRVLETTGYNPEEVVGFAFGMGVERIAMLKYGIPDLRLFFENDIRFLHQF
ncbi:MAG: Phenylalanine--tRNA ligase alpha subunit [Thermoanaerobacterales bacterium 50_218]|nr:MAG: Phenylalanine--tRNA ligase alpha subunit [Thermoanaerobacterales bacterium 50_218]